jgi:hypothetical protein
MDGGSWHGSDCFGLRKTTIEEWAMMGRKTDGHDEACWTICDGWVERKMGRRGK